MDFLSKLLQGISFVPSVVNGIEGYSPATPAPRKRARRCRLYQPLCNSRMP
jgi:hypothetical protein